ncbi:MAG: bifunctional phosphoribosylaminoimidazolecarboxamide formyltransferase/IMP cyclohydrolase, partial [Saprospiraceae bacterium]|nr:bifunctional phosphoribosylaminoimidazolecarboxamide formyltransferase/IMP cyclohydrolase [Saprospiraceae bacterium]
MEARIQNALISVFDKTGLEAIIHQLSKLGVKIYSTGGTADFIQSIGAEVHQVETLTGYPSILDGRVKTLHPKVFGGILARREEGHLSQLATYDIPTLDLVIVDLYPFEKTVASTTDEATIIEKIDIGGISLIRAAAKNYQDVVIVPSQSQYAYLLQMLEAQADTTTLDQRRTLAAAAFEVTSHYDSAIYNYFAGMSGASTALKVSKSPRQVLRYGENPHQSAEYYGNLDEIFDFLGGKELSYNNLVDVDAAVALMAEFQGEKPSFAIIKHTNACGVASRDTNLEAWNAALAADPVSAFGGIFITNTEVDEKTAAEVDKLFYEILIAPSYTQGALDLLMEKKKRIILKLKLYPVAKHSFKTLLNGVIRQELDQYRHKTEEWKTVTKKAADTATLADLQFANKCVKHLKSNTIVLIKNGQMIGMGCGQTSRVDACHQAIDKARRFGFDVAGSVMASDAFFPFPDCVEIAHNAGINAVVQPGGSIKDQ